MVTINKQFLSSSNITTLKMTITGKISHILAQLEFNDYSNYHSLTRAKDKYNDEISFINNDEKLIITIGDSSKVIHLNTEKEVLNFIFSFEHIFLSKAFHIETWIEIIDKVSKVDNLKDAYLILRTYENKKRKLIYEKNEIIEELLSLITNQKIEFKKNNPDNKACNWKYKTNSYIATETISKKTEHIVSCIGKNYIITEIINPYTSLIYSFKTIIQGLYLFMDNSYYIYGRTYDPAHTLEIIKYIKRATTASKSFNI